MERCYRPGLPAGGWCDVPTMGTHLHVARKRPTSVQRCGLGAPQSSQLTASCARTRRIRPPPRAPLPCNIRCAAAARRPINIRAMGRRCPVNTGCRPTLLTSHLRHRIELPASGATAASEPTVVGSGAAAVAGSLGSVTAGMSVGWLVARRRWIVGSAWCPEPTVGGRCRRNSAPPRPSHSAGDLCDPRGGAAARSFPAT